MRAAALASLFAPAAALVLACSGASTHSGFDTAGDGGSSGGSSGGLGSSGSGGSSGGLGSSGGSGSSSGGGNGCSGQAADFVYVLSAENDLYRFAPAAKQFTKIGPLGCQTGGMQPNSMAVDRNAVAYVNYVQSDPLGGQDTAGAIYQVSTSNAACMGKVLDLPGGWYRVGMGYSSNGTGSTAETLYVAATGNGMGGQSQGLGLVDFGKKTVGPIGPFTGSLSGQNAELTGTGDGRLYGFFTTNPVEVAQITKTSGATQTPVPMTGVQTPNDWAFSFWGGHFYLYTSQGQGVGNGSDVTDYDPSTGNVDTTYMTGIGFDIVGAGVSTCAPVTPPQ